MRPVSQSMHLCNPSLLRVPCHPHFAACQSSAPCHGCLPCTLLRRRRQRPQTGVLVRGGPAESAPDDEAPIGREHLRARAVCDGVVGDDLRPGVRWAVIAHARQPHTHRYTFTDAPAQRAHSLRVTAEAGGLEAAEPVAFNRHHSREGGDRQAGQYVHISVKTVQVCGLMPLHRGNVPTPTKAHTAVSMRPGARNSLHDGGRLALGKQRRRRLRKRKDPTIQIQLLSIAAE